MLEKNPEKRISAEQALNHRFLTTDRPIFKFKKSNKFDQEVKVTPMRMYHNFEEIDEH